MNLKYLPCRYKPAKRFASMPLYDVKSAWHKNVDKKRMLIVIDHIESDDLESGCMLSGQSNYRFYRLAELAHSYFGSKNRLEDYDWLCVPFNQFKTYDIGDSEIRSAINSDFAEHIKQNIVDYQPDIVLVMGVYAFRSLCVEELVRTKGNATNYLGTVIDYKVKSGTKSFKTKLVPTLSPNDLFNKNDGELSYLAGFVAGHIAVALDRKFKFNIDPVHEMVGGKFKPLFQINILDTIEKVRKFFKKLKAYKKPVAIDSEAINLYIVSNKIQTMQFSPDPDTAYFLYMYHQDSPFTAKELDEITVILRDYFETNENEMHIGANLKYDYNLFRHGLGIRHFKAPIWDIQAAEFVMDENKKQVYAATNDGYYNLGNLAVQYGTFAFYDNPFGKENRAHIADSSLTHEVIIYCLLDTVVPYRIYHKQLERAKSIGYDNYDRVVQRLLSDQIHAFSILETTGALCDIKYLFSLAAPDSNINQIIRDKEKAILETPEVKQANLLLQKAAGIPSKGLLGSASRSIFSLKTNEHKQVLFFDVLGLKMLTEGKKVRKNGKKEGKIDKKFQKTYAHVPIVAAFTDLKKALKLKEAYVDSFLSKYATNLDFKATNRLRPTYSYQDVVTGRTSASDPNLQQIPSRGALAKTIKRLLISSPGTLLIKVDYSAHEVRGWSIISGDKGVADLFKVGADLRKRFKLVPDKLIKMFIKDKGDVHRINAAYFFGVDIIAVTEKIRDAVKGVIFGLIYQQGDDGLAESTGRTVQEISGLKLKFGQRFPVGFKWFDAIKNFARQKFYVQSPLGRRRYLWPLAFKSVVDRLRRREDRNLKSFISKSERQSVNSPVQGFGSDFMMIAIRLIDTYMYEYYLETGVYPGMKLNVSVHDSLTVETEYEWFWLAAKFIEKAMTVGAQEYIEKHFQYKILSTPEIDFEIGPSEDAVMKWDRSYDSLREIITKTLDLQEEKLEHKIDKPKVIKHIMEKQWSLMPKWAHKQLDALSIKIPGFKPSLSKEERKLADKYLKERGPNEREMQRILDEREANKKREEEKIAAGKKKQYKSGLRGGFE